MYEIQTWSEGFVTLVATLGVMWSGLVILYMFHPTARATISKYSEQIGLASIMLVLAIFVAYTLAAGNPSGDRSAFSLYQTFTGLPYWLAILILEFGYTVHKYSHGRIDWRILSALVALALLLGYYIYLLQTLPSV